MTRAAADEIRVVANGPGDPVDVRRLERRDLAEGMVMELPERDHGRLGRLERGRGRAAEMAEAIAHERAGRGRSTRRLAPDGAGLLGRVPA